MSLSLRNRQFAGNICLVLFLAFMFTLLPGQLFTDNAYANTFTPSSIYSEKINNDNPNYVNEYDTIEISGITDLEFASSWDTLVTHLKEVSSLIYEATYQKIYSQEYGVEHLVYLWYDNTSDKVYDNYDWVYHTDERDGQATVPVKVWRPPTPSGRRNDNPPVTPAIPAVPAVPTVKPATPAIPAVVTKLVTYQPTVAQVKVINTITENLKEDKYLKAAPQASNVVVSAGKNKVSIPKLVITSSKVVIIMPLTTTKLDPKAVDYKIGVIKAYLAAMGITNVPVRIVFLNADPELKVAVKPGSYYSVATEGNLAKAISSQVTNKTLGANKAKIAKAFGIKSATVKQAPKK